MAASGASQAPPSGHPSSEGRSWCCLPSVGAHGEPAVLDAALVFGELLPTNRTYSSSFASLAGAESCSRLSGALKRIRFGVSASGATAGVPRGRDRGLVLGGSTSSAATPPVSERWVNQPWQTTNSAARPPDRASSFAVQTHLRTLYPPWFVQVLRTHMCSTEETDDMTILITGGAGFIGANLVLVASTTQRPPDRPRRPRLPATSTTCAADDPA